jgi:hypothetical protein
MPYGYLPVNTLIGNRLIPRGVVDKKPEVINNALQGSVESSTYIRAA